ncbi:MAG: Crp/Fnr family transcriptional regulator [Byssovorax sp.]
METDRARPRPVSPEAEAELKLRLIGSSPFAPLAGPTRAALLELGRIETFSRRHRLVEQGDAPRSLVLLGSGRVKVERRLAERIFPLGHRGPGQLVGETVLAGVLAGSETPGATESAIVVDPVEALALPMSGVRKLLLADLAFRAAVASMLLASQREAEHRLGSLLLLGVEARLISFLLDGQRRWGKVHPDGELITAAFTHADIAMLIGSTRETVTLLLGKLKRAGLIDFDRRRVLIRDRDGLSRHASGL